MQSKEIQNSSRPFLITILCLYFKLLCPIAAFNTLKPDNFLYLTIAEKHLCYFCFGVVVVIVPSTKSISHFVSILSISNTASVMYAESFHRKTACVSCAINSSGCSSFFRQDLNRYCVSFNVVLCVVSFRFLLSVNHSNCGCVSFHNFPVFCFLKFGSYSNN
jgi:hypothetical protein